MPIFETEDADDEFVGGEAIEVVSTDAVGARLDAWLTAIVEGLTRNQAQRAVSEGRVLVDGLPPKKAGQALRAGQRVTLRAGEVRPTELIPEDIPLQVAYADEHLVVIDKPPGLVVHPGAGHYAGTLVHGLLFWARARGLALALSDVERPGIVHRIDKDTSGLLVVALNDATLVGLQKLFQAHDLERVYRAVLLGHRRADEGIIDTTHARDSRDRKRFTGRQSEGRRAVTHWRELARGEALTLAECRLETGRTHQIRVHMSESGTPIVADPIYGSAVPNSIHGAQSANVGLELRAARAMPRLALHAAVLGFRHPITGAALRFEAPDPPDFAELVAAIVPSRT